MHPELAYMSIAPSLATVAGILERAPAAHTLRFEFCVFRNTIVNSEGKPLADIDLIKAQHELETQFRWVDHPPGATVVHQAVQLAADKNRVDPVHAYLKELKWDTKPRLSNLLTDYFGAEEYDKEHPIRIMQSRSILCSAVGRALCPGLKVDTMPILVSPQGWGKSTAIRLLCPDPEWFSDTPLDLRSNVKDAYIGIQGKWIIEVAEMQSILAASHATVKAFLTSQADTYREPYKRCAVTRKRRCVFIGTSNDLQLTDSTGSRRFWPIPLTKKPDWTAIERDRDQLWAEAYNTWCVRVNEGRTHYDPELEFHQAFQEEKALFDTGDPWEVLIEDYWRRQPYEFTLADILEFIGIAKREQTIKHNLRIGRLLVAQGFTKLRKRGQGKRQYKWTK